MTPSQIEALCDRKLPYYPTTTKSSKLLAFVPMLSCFILVRIGIVFLLLSKVKPFICASYPICSHLPQGLWYFGSLVVLIPFLHRHVLLFLIHPVSKGTWFSIYHLKKPSFGSTSPARYRPSLCSMTHWNLWKELPSLAFSPPIHPSTLSNLASVTTLPMKLLLLRLLVTFSNWKC